MKAKGTRAGKAAAHAGDRGLLLFFFFFSICGLPNYNEACYLRFKQDGFVPAIQKATE